MTRCKRRGRQARQEAPPAVSAVWPGVSGGRFRPLSRADEQQVHRTILDVLENIGMADPIPLVRERYFLAVRARAVRTAPVERLLEVLRG